MGFEETNYRPSRLPRPKRAPSGARTLVVTHIVLLDRGLSSARKLFHRRQLQTSGVRQKMSGSTAPVEPTDCWRRCLQRLVRSALKRIVDQVNASPLSVLLCSATKTVSLLICRECSADRIPRSEGGDPRESTSELREALSFRDAPCYVCSGYGRGCRVSRVPKYRPGRWHEGGAQDRPIVRARQSPSSARGETGTPVAGPVAPRCTCPAVN